MVKMAATESMSTVAFELTSAAVFNELGLEEYVQDRSRELSRAELVELVSVLAAVAGATYEVWAELAGQSVEELLSAAGMHNAQLDEDD